MNIDEKEEISVLVDKRIKDANLHTTASAETKQFMDKINTELTFIKEKLEEVPTRDEVELSNRKLLEEMMCKADERYAGKLTEKIVYGLVGAILLAFLGLIIKFVL